MGSRGVLLRGRVLSPVDPARAEAFEDGFVEVDPQGTIGAAGAWPEERDPRAAVHVGRALILPAFVDAHVHLPQLPVRARYGDPLLIWLARHVYPAESAFADSEHAAREAARFFGALAGAGLMVLGARPLLCTRTPRTAPSRRPPPAVSGSSSARC